MSDYLRLLLIFAVAINPAAAWRAFEPIQKNLGRRRAVTTGLAVVVAGGMFVASVAVADPLLDWLDVAPETFRIATGIVMAVSGMLVLVLGRSAIAMPSEDASGWQAGIFPLAIPLLAGPAALIAGMSYGVDEGEAKAWLAAMPAVVVGAALALVPLARWRPVADGVARVCAGVLVIVASGLVVEGVRDI